MIERMVRSGGVVGTALTVAVALVLSGCSATVPGEAVAGEVRLDTGNFATTPRDVPARVGDDAAVQGNIALGDSVVMPSEVDPALDWGLYRLFPSLPDANSMVRMMGERLGVALQPGRVAGVVAPATEDPNSDAAPQATFLVLRYSAEHYARAAFDAVAAIPATVAGPAPDAYPAAHVGPQPESFRAGPAIWLRHKDYILGATFANIADANRVRRLAGAFFDKQIPKLDTVPFTAAQLLQQPADKDGIRRLTRIDTTESTPIDYTSGYYSVHTFLMNSTGRRSTGKDTLAVHGIDLIAYQGRNQVFRAANSDRAADYVRYQGSDSRDRTAQGYRREDAVPGLNGSACLSTITNLYGQANRVFACYASRGRYAVGAQGASLLQAQQGAAASYTVLKNAE